MRTVVERIDHAVVIRIGFLPCQAQATVRRLDGAGVPPIRHAVVIRIFCIRTGHAIRPAIHFGEVLQPVTIVVCRRIEKLGTPRGIKPTEFSVVDQQQEPGKIARSSRHGETAQGERRRRMGRAGHGKILRVSVQSDHGVRILPQGGSGQIEQIVVEIVQRTPVPVPIACILGQGIDDRPNDVPRLDGILVAEKNQRRPCAGWRTEPFILLRQIGIRINDTLEQGDTQTAAGRENDFPGLDEMPFEIRNEGLLPLFRSVPRSPLGRERCRDIGGIQVGRTIDPRLDDPMTIPVKRLG